MYQHRSLNQRYYGYKASDTDTNIYKYDMVTDIYLIKGYVKVLTTYFPYYIEKFTY